jgi:hypothetical protein
VTVGRSFGLRLPEEGQSGTGNPLPHVSSEEREKVPVPTPDSSAALPPAAYLRYDPDDLAGLAGRLNALRAFAARLGLPDPVFYLDHGSTSHAPRPYLHQFARAARRGTHHLLLVPGLWVFSPDDTQARLTVRHLIVIGGVRVLQLPPPATRRTTSSPATHDGVRGPCP